MKKLIFLKNVATIIVLLFITQNAYTQKGTSPVKCVETADKYCIEIVPNEYEGVYQFTRNEPLSGKHTELLGLGKHSICVAANCEDNSIEFEVVKDGEITLVSNPTAITATNRKLEFNIVDFTIDFVDYTDEYCLEQYRNLQNRSLCKGTPDDKYPQIRIFKVVKNLKYNLTLYNEEDNGIVSHVDAKGQVSCISNAAAANVYGKSLQLKTSKVQITSKDYKGTIKIGNKEIKVPGTIIIVRNITILFEYSSSKKFFIKNDFRFIPEELIFSTGKKKQQIVFNFKCIKNCSEEKKF